MVSIPYKEELIKDMSSDDDPTDIEEEGDEGGEKQKKAEEKATSSNQPPLYTPMVECDPEEEPEPPYPRKPTDTEA